MIKVKLFKGLFLMDKKDFTSLNTKGFGYKSTENTYELDIYETLFLLEKKTIEVIQNKTNKNITFEQILNKHKIEINNYIVYKDLKKRGYYVKSGLKYGFVFRIYNKGIKIGEDHSLWLVEPMHESKKIEIKDIVGKNRIAHSTRKKMLFAIIDNDSSITYIENSWNRM